jgi:hypothetical protein
MKLSHTRRLLLLGAAVAAIAGVASLLACPFPDALEDSLEQHWAVDGLLTGGAPGSSVAGETTEASGTWSAPFPDYAVPGVECEGLGGALAGILGAAGTFAVLFLLVYLLGRNSAAPSPSATLASICRCRSVRAAESEPDARCDRAGRTRRGPSHVAVSQRPGNAAGGPRRRPRHG